MINCSDTGKLISLICMSVRESLYKSLTENNWESLISHLLVLNFHITLMASPIGYQWLLEDPDFVDTWPRRFAAGARTKKLKDDKESGKKIRLQISFWLQLDARR